MPKGNDMPKDDDLPNTAAAIIAVFYDGATVSVQWSPASDASVIGYQILVSSPDSGVVYQTPTLPGVMTNYGELTLPGSLNSNIPFTVQVQSETKAGAGDASAAVPLLVATA